MAKKKRIDRRSLAQQPNREDLVPIAFRLSPDLVKQLDAKARSVNVSRSWLVEILLKDGAGLELDTVETAVKEKVNVRPSVFA